MRSLLAWNQKNFEEDSIEILKSLDDLGCCLRCQDKIDENRVLHDQFFGILSHKLSKGPIERVWQSRLEEMLFYKWAQREIIGSRSSGVDGEQSKPSIEEVVDWYYKRRGLSRSGNSKV